MARTSHGYDRQFKKGERGFCYYSMEWGTVLEDADDSDTSWNGWFKFEGDSGDINILNDERVVTAAVARRFGYPDDPRG